MSFTRARIYLCMYVLAEDVIMSSDCVHTANDRILCEDELHILSFICDAFGVCRSSLRKQDTAKLQVLNIHSATWLNLLTFKKVIVIQIQTQQDSHIR